MVKEKKIETFIDKVFHEGHIVTLYGPPGAGKSNCAGFFMEMAIEQGYHVFTNIHFFKFRHVKKACLAGKLPTGVFYKKKPDEVHVAKTLSDLLIGLMGNDKNIVMLDEAGIFASSTAPMSKMTKQIKELAYIIRHFSASLLLITQTKGSISPDLRKTLVKYEMNIEKKRGKYRLLSIGRAVPYVNDDGEHDVRFEVIRKIGRIPLTRLPWDGYFIPKFDFDISLDDARNRLSDYSSVEVREQDENGEIIGVKIIRELLEQSEKPKKGKNKTSMDALNDQVREQFLTYEDSGEYKNRSHIVSKLESDFPWSYNKIYQLCRDLDFDGDKYKGKKVKSKNTKI